MTSTDLLNHDAATQAATDDFKRIKGIGPGIERRLHANGILTFAQLATLSADDIAVLVSDIAGLSAQRITEQNWIGQAQELASKQGIDSSPNDTLAATSRQHYATFNVELLLEEGNAVRRTRVVHIQSGYEDSWAGWEEKRLLDSITQHAGIYTDDSRAALMGSPDEHSMQQARAEAEEPASDLQLTVGDLLVYEVPAHEHMRAQGVANRIRIQMNFSTPSLDAYLSAAGQSHYLVEILAFELETGKRVVLARELQRLQRGQADYAINIESELPEVGRYQLQGTVQLLDFTVLKLSVGPVLNVVP